MTQETFVAKNLNDLLLKAITTAEIQNGVKICGILASHDGIYFEKMKGW